MTFDLQAAAKRFSAWSGDAVLIAGAVTRLWASYQALEPTAKASIAADIQAVEASWVALDVALNNYESANPVSKIAAAIAVGDTIAKLAPLVGKIATDGQTLFGSDWPIIQQDITVILNILKGSST